jgi:hypothetical protein
LGAFRVLEKIIAYCYLFELPYTFRLHPLFHVHNLRPCPTATVDRLLMLRLM